MNDKWIWLETIEEPICTDTIDDLPEYTRNNPINKGGSFDSREKCLAAALEYYEREMVWQSVVVRVTNEIIANLLANKSEADGRRLDLVFSAQKIRAMMGGNEGEK